MTSEEWEALLAANPHVDLDALVGTEIALMFMNWDMWRPTEECPHCDHGRLVPSTDGRTKCGFCG